MRIELIRVLVTLAAGAGLTLHADNQDPNRISGRVVHEGSGVADCSVRAQGSKNAVRTDPEGRFTIAIERAGVYLTAGKEGFYNNRVLATPGKPVEIEMRPIPGADNAGYAWQDPRPNKARKDNCGNCHDRIYSEWSRDGHAQAAVSPLVMTMYNGTDVQGRPYRGPGYRIDWNDEGSCSTCHAPSAAISEGKDVNLAKVTGASRAGVGCDFCHKVQSVSKASSSPDFADVRMLRPAAGKKLLFGPYDDATFPEEVPDFSYSSLFKQSLLCAPCHDGKFWGVPVYETYTEWRESRYESTNVQCQDCHMGPTRQERFIANVKSGGKEREPATIGSHSMMGRDLNTFIASAVLMKTQSNVKESLLQVEVTIENTGAGHHIPTGQPIRNLILLVTAKDAAGNNLELLQGERVPSWGGLGAAANDYAGLPGKGFAKILQTLNEYQKFSFVSDLRKVEGDFPAPFWRRNRILSDNRIPAKGKDQSVYVFRLPPDWSATQVNAKLIYRRAFKALSDVKGWNLPDMVIASNEASIHRSATRD
jgi:nitrate/TMAO reductase-like tetraheme cytochrome c subunit